MLKTPSRAFRPRESIRPGSLWKVLGSVAWVRCWRPPVIGHQVTVFLLRRASVSVELHHDHSPLVLESDKGVCSHRFFSWLTSAVTQNIRRFIEGLLRVAQRVPGSRMRPSEPELRTTGLMNWIDSHGRVDQGATVGRAGSTVFFLQTIWYC